MVFVQRRGATEGSGTSRQHDAPRQWRYPDAPLSASCGSTVAKKEHEEHSGITENNKHLEKRPVYYCNILFLFTWLAQTHGPHHKSE